MLHFTGNTLWSQSPVVRHLSRRKEYVMLLKPYCYTYINNGNLMNPLLSVLLVEDSESDAELIVRHLENTGYNIAHRCVETAEQMREALDTQPWDIILSDYSLPAFSASAALELLQQTGVDIPFIIVSEVVDGDAAVTLMKAGAHDYVAKNTLEHLAPTVYWEMEEAKDRRLQRLADQELQVREARYRAVAECAIEAIITIDAAGNILEWNAAAERMYGYPRNDAVGQPIALIIPDRFKEQHRHSLISRQQGECPSVVGETREVKGKRRDGSEFPMELSLTTYDIGAVRYYTAIIRDITERRKAEESLQLASLVYQNSSEAMTVTDADGNIITVNPAFTRVTGYTAEEVIGKNTRILNSGRHDQAFFQNMWQQLNSSGHWQGKVWNRRKSGEVYPELLTINTIFNEDGSPHRRVALFVDITQRHEG